MSSTDILSLYDSDEWDGLFRFIECKRALSPSGLPDMDYALNPYGGCEHGCIYCYAPEVLHSGWEDWRVVKVRYNIIERLSKELLGIKGIIGIGTVTDPYQDAEKRFKLTQQCLQILKRKEYPIHLHTKSDNILRDIELLSSMKGEVGITITTLDEKYSKMTEPGAPLPDRRIKALNELTKAGINTYALLGPVLNHLEGNEKELVDAIVSTGTKRVVIDSLNHRPALSERLSRMNLAGSLVAKEKIMLLVKSAGLDIKNVF